jgi:hypothetical protein
MCKREAHGDFERRMMPADSNFLNSALAISSFSRSRWWDFAKTRGFCRCACDAQPHALVLASHPQFSKWREIFEAKFWHLQALNLELAAFGWG